MSGGRKNVLHFRLHSDIVVSAQHPYSLSILFLVSLFAFAGEHMFTERGNSTHEVKNEIFVGREQIKMKRQEKEKERERRDRKNCPLIGIHLYSMRQSFSIRVTFFPFTDSQTKYRGIYRGLLLSRIPTPCVYLFLMKQQRCGASRVCTEIEIECLIVNQA